MGSWEQRLTRLGLELPRPLPPAELYAAVAADNHYAFMSGIVAIEGDPPSVAFAGRLGENLTVKDGMLSARRAMLCGLALIRATFGSLDVIDRFLHLRGYVNATPDFGPSPAVVDGASELLATIFGPERLPARTALGVASLSGNASVELDAVIKLEER